MTAYAASLHTIRSRMYTRTQISGAKDGVHQKRVDVVSRGTRILLSWAMLVSICVLGVLYIYIVNTTVVGTLAIQKAGKDSLLAEREITALEARRIHMSVGGNLETRARDLGLEAPQSLTFMQRDMLARAGF